MSTELHSTDSRDRAPVATAEADGAPPTGRAPSWRLVAVMALLIPTFVIAIAAMFVSLAVDPEPHQAPLGLVAPPPAAQAIETALADRAGEDAFAVERFADPEDARAAIERRDLVGAIAVGPGGVTVLTAEAGSPVLAQVVARLNTVSAWTGAALEAEARRRHLDSDPVVQLKIRNYTQQLLANELLVSLRKGYLKDDAALTKQYEANKNSYAQPRVRQILVRARAQSRCRRGSGSCRRSHACTTRRGAA